MAIHLRVLENGCVGTFSDIDTSVVNEGAVVSYVSPADGKEYVYSYGLMYVNKTWVPISPWIFRSRFLTY